MTHAWLLELLQVWMFDPSRLMKFKPESSLVQQKKKKLHVGVTILEVSGGPPGEAELTQNNA